MLIFVKERVLEWKRYSPLQFAIQRYREEFLGLGKIHQGKVLVSMAEYFPLLFLSAYGQKEEKMLSPIAKKILPQTLTR